MHVRGLTKLITKLKSALVRALAKVKHVRGLAKLNVSESF